MSTPGDPNHRLEAATSQVDAQLTLKASPSLPRPYPALAEPYGHVGVPLYPAVTYDERAQGPYDYARSGNPTRSALETSLAALDHAAQAFAMASGQAAITAAFLTLHPGDHVIVTEDCQGGTTRVLDGLFAGFGVSATYVPTHDLAAVAQAVGDPTRVVFVENFSNPFLRFTDIEPLAKWAHARGLQVWVDNTLMTPLLMRPLDLGADLVLHSATKYMGGHGDLMAGSIAVNDPTLAERLHFVQNATGIGLGVEECWLLTRGLETLSLRFFRSQASALILAQRLMALPALAETIYPGLPGHPDHTRVKATLDGYGAMITLRLRDPERREAILARLAQIAVGPGSGSTHTILGVMERHCHAPVPPAVRAERGITGGLLRLSVGVEDPDLLWADLKRALEVE